MSTASTSEKRTPCFRRFAWALLGSQVTFMYVLYTYLCATSTAAEGLAGKGWRGPTIDELDHERIVRPAPAGRVPGAGDPGPTGGLAYGMAWVPGSAAFAGPVL